MEKKSEKEKEILPKLLELKEIISEKIKTFEDYTTNKITLLSIISQIESIINPSINNKTQESPQKEEPKEIIKEDSLNEKDIEKIIINNPRIKEEKENNEENIENNIDNENNNYNQEEEESEKHSLPKLNFDYDKNVNEILNNINLSNQKQNTKESNELIIDNKPIIINEENIKQKNKKISNMQNNGYSNLFSFNQELSTTEDLTSKKNKIHNSENINNNNSIEGEENISMNNNSKALRVADIIMKINSNDILYDIISQLYSKEILDQLMSPDVDINLINIIEQTIEKITILENEEIQKLKNKESSIVSNVTYK